MLICQCNMITAKEIEDIVLDLLRPIPGSWLSRPRCTASSKRRAKCSGCVPNVVDIIVRVTENYHAQLAPAGETRLVQSGLEKRSKGSGVRLERRSKVIERLNEALFLELGAVNQYWVHYPPARRLGLQEAGDQGTRRIHRRDAPRRSSLIERIIFLEGHPNLQRVAPLRIGQSIKEVLEADLAGEYEARAAYKTAARSAKSSATMSPRTCSKHC